MRVMTCQIEDQKAETFECDCGHVCNEMYLNLMHYLLESDIKKDTMIHLFFVKSKTSLHGVVKTIFQAIHEQTLPMN